MPRFLILSAMLSACHLNAFKTKAPTFETDGSGSGGAAGPSVNELTTLKAIANAGPDQEVLRGASVILDGRRSFHPLGNDFSVRWSQTTGDPVVTLSNAAKALTSFTAPAKAARLSFTITATMADRTQTEDTVVINVVDFVTHTAPTLFTNGDRIVTPFADVDLSAFLLGGHLDTDLNWTQVRGASTVELSAEGPYKKNLKVTAPQSGFVIYSVEAQGDGLRSAPDFTIVLADSATAAAPSAEPTEIAPLDVNPNDEVTLKGDGQSKASVWTQLIGEAVEFTSQEAGGWKFRAPRTPQLMWFSYVSNGISLRTSPLIQRVHVGVGAKGDTASSIGTAVASAGPDEGAHPGNTVTLDGTQSKITKGAYFEWTQTLGPVVTLTDPFTATPSFTAPAAPADIVFVLRIRNDSDGAASLPDSVVINVHDSAQNGAPVGGIGARLIESASYALSAKVQDPDNDPFSCTWSAEPWAVFYLESGSDANVTLDGSVTIYAKCCDRPLNACTTFTLPLP